MKKVVGIVFLLIMIPCLFAGCASSKKMQALESDNERISSEKAALQEELDRAQTRISEQEQQLAALQAEREQEIAALKQTYESLISELQKEIKSGQVQIKQVKTSLQLTIAEQLFFETGKAEIKPQGQAVLRRIGPILKKIPQKNIRIEGHTDNVPIGPSLRAQYPTNWDLGAARAVNVVGFLQKESGLDPLRLSAVSYGQYRPVASNKTEAGRAKNRRIEIILIDRDLDLAKKMKGYL